MGARRRRAIPREALYGLPVLTVGMRRADHDPDENSGLTAAGVNPRLAAPRIVAPESATPGATPVDAQVFEALMQPLGPFEPAPRIAVAVSGGSDSLALCLLADRWARARGGTVYALTVDHGLRPESGAEAAQVRRWLAGRSIFHRTLKWTGAPRTGATQAEARAARFALLTGWCRRAGVLHLLLGHQREDQAETALQRLVHGSGIEGLAAMAPVRLATETDGTGVRLLRPLLSVPQDALIATLAHCNQPWIDDPTNRDARHARPRFAAALAQLASEGLSAARLARVAARAADDRAALDRLCTELLAGCAHPAPAGFVMLDVEALRRAPPALALRALGRAVTTVSGAPHAPRQERLDRLAHRLLADKFRAATLGGCRVVAQEDGRIVVCREPTAASEVVALKPGDSLLWDRRFVVSLARSVKPGRFVVRRLGTDGLAQARATARAAGKPLRTDCVPAPARPALPALFDLDGPLAAPHLNYRRTGHRNEASAAGFAATFAPAHPLAPGLPATLRVLPLQDKTIDETVEETIDRP